MAARGIWIELLCLMHEAVPYGHLLINGQSPTDTQIGVLAGAPPDQITALLGELESAGVFSRTRAGVIYSRKMTRMVKKAAEARKSGQSGGNPKLTNGYKKPGYVYAIGRRSDGAVKIGISVNPRNRIKKIRAQYRGDDLEILGSIWTEDMGTHEGTLHKDLDSKCAGGEWFHLSDSDLKSMGFISDPKGSIKGAPFAQKLEARSQNKSVANATDADGVNFTREVFDRGVAFLGRFGTSERKARSIIGMWRSGSGDSETFNAMREANQLGVTDPVAWITKRLQPKSNGQPDLDAIFKDLQMQGTTQ